MTKKTSLTFCAAALLAAGATAASLHAQRRADAPADTRETRHDAKTHDAKTHEAKSHDAKTHDAGVHHAEVNARGEHAMGFSQTETAHHFRLTRDGGLIEVEVKDPADASNRERVRRHLAHVSEMFAAGDFKTPMLVHARTPPGAEAMSRLKAELVYAFEETERGGRVRIKARSAEALAAVHDFLRFQIEDHQTGDPAEVK